MPIARRLARPLLAAVFVVGGVTTLRNPKAVTPAAEDVVKPVVDNVDQIRDTEHLVTIDAAVKVVAGTALAFGYFPRLSALALAGSLVPTTVAGHAFWNEQDPQTRQQQQLHFLKNASMLGGLILAAVDTHGKPSVAWRLRRAPDAVKRSANEARLEAALAAKDVTHSIKDAATTVRHALPV